MTRAILAGLATAVLAFAGLQTTHAALAGHAPATAPISTPIPAAVCHAVTEDSELTGCDYVHGVGWVPTR